MPTPANRAIVTLQPKRLPSNKTRHDMNRFTMGLPALLLATAAMIPAAHAEPSSPWAVQIGVHNVDPKSDNGLGIKVDNAVGLTMNARYFVNPSFAIDLLAALPFQHDVSADGAGKIAKVRHLPPTLSAMWYPMPDAKVKPFIGAGLNYTTFFDIKEKGALSGTKLKLKDSFGPAAMIGVEVPVSAHGAVFADLRWMDIDTKASVDGNRIGTLHIDPIAYGVAYVYRF
jgi:outer membrane protein